MVWKNCCSLLFVVPIFGSSQFGSSVDFVFWITSCSLRIVEARWRVKVNMCGAKRDSNLNAWRRMRTVILLPQVRNIYSEDCRLIGITLEHISFLSYNHSVFGSKIMESQWSELWSLYPQAWKFSSDVNLCCSLQSSLLSYTTSPLIPHKQRDRSYNRIRVSSPNDLVRTPANSRQAERVANCRVWWNKLQHLALVLQQILRLLLTWMPRPSRNCFQNRPSSTWRKKIMDLQFQVVWEGKGSTTERKKRKEFREPLGNTKLRQRLTVMLKSRGSRLRKNLE